MQNHKPAAQHPFAGSGLGSRSGSKGMIYGNVFHQSGAALMVSLMILLVLTLIGVTSMSSTILEEKMAGGVRNQNLSFQSAEAALRDGEIWIGGQNPVPRAVALCGSPPCQVVELDSLGDLTAQNDAWWSSNAREYGVTGTPEVGVSADPRYIVEYRTFEDIGGLDVGTNSFQRRFDYYRLTARGTGGNTTTETILQSHYMIVAN